jgi:hypothetical protein
MLSFIVELCRTINRLWLNHLDSFNARPEAGEGWLRLGSIYVFQYEYRYSNGTSKIILILAAKWKITEALNTVLRYVEFNYASDLQKWPFGQ